MPAVSSMDRFHAQTHASVGPYQLLSLIGEGGSGQVYRAWDPRLQREVALKVLRDSTGAGPGRLRRFVEEARAASALNHPNIVTVFDAAVDSDTPFIVTELIEGARLRDEMNRGPIPLKRVLDLGTQIADGLSAAHGAGMVHRDLKPENVMVTRAGRVKILDFGLARPTGLAAHDPAMPQDQCDQTQTQTELALHAGTVPYMSPEQARGGPIGFASDQFSLGLTLYEMLAGRSPFRRETAAGTLDAIINDEAPMSALEARAPVWLRWIVERCLAKDPHERYGSTTDLHRDLKTLRDRLAETARDDVSIGRGPSFKRRRLMLGAAGIAALGAGALMIVALTPTPAETPTLRFTPFATESGYEGLPAWSPDGQTIAYAAEADGILQIFTRRITAGASAAQVTDAAFDCRYPFWSSDGRRLYYVSLAGYQESIWSISAAGGTPQVAVENAVRGAMSPDGRTLAFLRDEQRGDIVGALTLWLATPGDTGPWPSQAIAAVATRYQAFGDLRMIEGAIAFSPDGRALGLSMVPRTIELAPERRGWQFWVLPIPQGQPVRRLQWWHDPAPRAAPFSWLADSRHVVLGMASLISSGSDLWAADLREDRAWPLTTSPDSELDPSSSPSGEQIVFTRGEADYNIVELSLDGAAPRPLVATTRNESDPVWSPDGQLLAYVSDRNGHEEIWLTSREGERRLDRPLITQRDFRDDRTIMLGAPSFSPDGQRIAYQRNAQKPIWPLRIWISLTNGGAPVPLLPPSHEGYQSAPTWSPDGQWIAFTGWKDRQWTLAKVRVGTGEQPTVLRSDGVPNATPRWSPSNDWITWETDRGFVLVSPDGATERLLTDDQWLAHTWSATGTEIFGIRETEDLRLQVVGVDARSARTRAIVDLGPSPPVNNAVKGLTVSADGRRLVTSIIGEVSGDLWLLDGLRTEPRSARWRWPFKSP
jgi:serine/threonine protein kinase/Tol biopolymer transport system component